MTADPEEQQTIQVSVELWRDGVFICTLDLESEETEEEILASFQEVAAEDGFFEVRRAPSHA